MSVACQQKPCERPEVLLKLTWIGSYFYFKLHLLAALCLKFRTAVNYPNVIMLNPEARRLF